MQSHPDQLHSQAVPPKASCLLHATMGSLVWGMAVARLSSPAAGAGRIVPQPVDKLAPTALQGVVLRRQSSENHFQMPPSVPPALLRVDAAAAAKAAPTGQCAGLSFQALQENKRLEAINS